MFKTSICDLFNIKYPIILGGMLWVGKADLVAAVSDAGGLGVLGAGGMTIEEITSEFKIVKNKTDKPFGVNIPLVRPDSEDMINAAIKAGAKVIVTSSGSPVKFTKMIQNQGCRVMHVVANVKFAKKSEDAGVDAIAAEGYEAGGHNGKDEITTMALIPQITEAVNIPVVAAGGIADGKGLAAALSLGAKGVQMGTRFVASNESAAHENFKDLLLTIDDIGTCITGRTTIGPTRAIKNRLTEMIEEAEGKGATSEELFEMIGEGRSIKACIEGDVEQGSMYCGQIGGKIKELKTSKQIIDDVIAEARTVIDGLSALI